jgi:chemotaxis protein methyltransferase CheR
MPEQDTPPLEAIRSWVSQQLGLRYDDDRRVVLARRLAALFGDHPGALTEVWQRLRARDPSTLLELAEIASTNHTYFFREPEAFELLARHVAPTLPHRARCACGRPPRPAARRRTPSP